jgi:hypothetical protein
MNLENKLKYGLLMTKKKKGSFTGARKTQFKNVSKLNKSIPCHLQFSKYKTEIY